MAIEMVERVAEAIWRTKMDGNMFGLRPAALKHQSQDNRDKYLAIARAAIEAMREPTPHMIEEGWDADKTTYESGGWNGQIDDAWRAMIDASLKDTP